MHRDRWISVILIGLTVLLFYAPLHWGLIKDLSDLLTQIISGGVLLLVAAAIGLWLKGGREEPSVADLEGHPYPRVKKNEKNAPPLLIGQTNATITLDLKSKTSRSKIHMYCISISGNPEVLTTAAENVEANLAPLPASGVLASVALPWVANLEGNLSKSLDLEGDVDFQNARDVIRSMSNYVKYEKATLAHRIGQHVVAFFGLESTGKIYLANKEPIELGRPIEGQMPACEFILGVSGSNIMLTQSDTYVAFASSWDNIGVGIKRPFPLGESPEKH